MLQQLLETKATPERRARSTVVSIALHAAVITLAVAATVKGEGGAEDRCMGLHPAPGCPQLPPVIYVDPTTGPGAAGPFAPGRTDGAIVPPALPDIPGLPGPDIDLPSIPTTGAFEGGDAGDGVGSDFAGAGSEPTRGGIASELSVDVPIRELEGRTPRYPAALRARGMSGVVLAEFVVDSTGRVDLGSFRAIDSPDLLFTEAVRAALRDARFTPGMVRGRPVRTLARRAYRFELR